MILVQLTTVHPRYDTRIFIKECRSLANAYPEQVVLVVADGHGDEFKDGIKVHDLGRPKGGRLGRALIGNLRSFRAARRLKATVVHFHDLELFPTGILLRMMGHKVIYDVHEDVKESIVEKQWIPRWIRFPVANGASLLEKAGSFLFDSTVSATPKIGERFRVESNVLVQNYPLLSELITPSAQPYAMREHMFVYLGGLTKRRGAMEMVEATGLISEDYDARLVLIGPLRPPALEIELEQVKGWTSTDYRGWGDRIEVADQFSKSRAGLVVLHAGPNHLESQPNKLFEYMSAGLPVIASDFPYWRQFVTDVGCGIMVDPKNPEAIANSMRWMLDNPDQAEEMGKRGRKAVEEIYNWGPEEKKLLILYQKLLS